MLLSNKQLDVLDSYKRPKGLIELFLNFDKRKGNWAKRTKARSWDPTTYT